MEKEGGRGKARVGGWLGFAGVGVLYLVAALWLPFPEGARPASRCAPGDWERTLAEASEAATRGHPGVALRCAYQAFLDAEAAGAAAGLVRVGDLLQRLGVQRYQRISVRSAYLRAADHARSAQDLPVMAAVATRLLARGEMAEASTLLEDICSRTDAGDPGVPCDPVGLAAVATLRGEE